MKSILTTMILICLCLTGLSQAEYSAENLKKGFIIGYNNSNATNADFASKSYNGLCVGGFLKYQSSSRLSYQFGLMYKGKGYIRENVATSDTLLFYDEVSIVLGYLEIPIQAKFSIVPHGKYRPYAFGGGFVSFLFWDRLRVDEFGPIIDSGIENAKNVDVGILLGTGIDMKSGENGWMFFEFRYEMSFIGPIQNYDHKIRSIGFNAGYWF